MEDIEKIIYGNPGYEAIQKLDRNQRKIKNYLDATNIGTLSSLKTTNKSSLVNAINENVDKINVLTAKATLSNCLYSGWEFRNDYYTPVISKTGNIVSIFCNLVPVPTTAGDTKIMQLPAGYAPKSSKYDRYGWGVGTADDIRFRISTDGSVQYNSGNISSGYIIFSAVYTI